MDTCKKWDISDEVYWEKYYECSLNAVKSLKFSSEFACEQGFEWNSKYQPYVIAMNKCELNVWNLIGAPYKKEVATICNSGDMSPFC